MLPFPMIDFLCLKIFYIHSTAITKMNQRVDSQQAKGIRIAAINIHMVRALAVSGEPVKHSQERKAC